MQIDVQNVIDKLATKLAQQEVELAVLRSENEQLRKQIEGEDVSTEED